MGKRFNHIAAIGEQFGMWTVLDDSKSLWRVVCQCGFEKEVRRDFLIRGLSKACMSCAQKKHGKEGSKVYMIWAGMKQRCQNPDYHHYEDYGGRGITVCEEWQSFDRFYADMGNPPKGASLGRINNDAGYSKQNCRWETTTQQARNKRTSTRVEGRSVADLADEHGIPAKRLRDRLKAGWPLDKALSLPPNKHNRV